MNQLPEGDYLIIMLFVHSLQDCSLKRIHVDHRTPNVDPDQVMAKNLDTGEFCRADLLVSGPVVQDPDWLE